MQANISNRGRQIRPTQTELNNAWKRIRAAADAGDLQANALLICLVDGSPLMHKDGGIINLGRGGWACEQNDPKAEILSAIRACDPDSKQLPENQ